jgi:hypothetical protein
VYVCSWYDIWIGGVFCLSNNDGLIIIPVASFVRAGVKSFNVLNNELSKYLINLM